MQNNVHNLKHARSPRIGLLHNTLNVMGGAERFTLDLIGLLHQQGMHVNIATFDKTRWDSVNQMFGKVDRPDNEDVLLPFRLRMFGIYQRIFMKWLVNRLDHKSDVVINTHSDHLFCKSDIVYIHGVSSLQSTTGALGLERYQKSLLMRIYFMPYRHLIMSKLKTYTDKDGTLFVANSKFSKQRLASIMSISNCQVIYPPVDTNTYSPLANNESRDDQVVTVARFTREKNLHLIPEIASRCKGIQFAIVTSAAGVKTDLMDEFTYACKKFGVESQIQIYMNIPFEKKLEIIGRSKVYLHMMPAEHFGIALAEGCSAGCLPVVVKGGGQEEVVDGIPHSVYDDLSHASDLVNLAISNWTPTKSKEVSAMMERFSEKNFSDQFCSLILDVYKSKRCK